MKITFNTYIFQYNKTYWDGHFEYTGKIIAGGSRWWFLKFGKWEWALAAHGRCFHKYQLYSYSDDKGKYICNKCKDIKFK